MILEHIYYTIIISLACIGINATTWQDMVFYNLSRKIENLIVKYTSLEIGQCICMPLFKCPMCMSSIWTFAGWFISGFDFNPVLMILTVCGMNVLFVALICDIMPDE